jgi:hypothetical protein
MQLKTIIANHFRRLPERVCTHYLHKACERLDLKPDDEVPTSYDTKLADFIVEAKQPYRKRA